MTTVRQIRSPLGDSEFIDSEQHMWVNTTSQERRFTHRKKQYRAYCLQYQLDNFKEINNLLLSGKAEVHLYSSEMENDNRLMIRWSDGRNPSIETIQYGMWVRRGENGLVKIYTDEEFLLKYESLES